MDRIILDGELSLVTYQDGEAGCVIKEKIPPVLEPLTAKANGSYTVPEGVDGYSPVTVDVPPAVIKPLTTEINGVYTAPEGVDGYSPVTVDVPPAVIEPLTATENGVYTVPEGVDGYNPVVVDVPPDLTTKTITANGTYQATDDNADGYETVTVSIPEYSGDYTVTPQTTAQTILTSGKVMTGDLTIDAYAEKVLVDKTIIENGTYQATDDNADGYSQVDINVIPTLWKTVVLAEDHIDSKIANPCYWFDYLGIDEQDVLNGTIYFCRIDNNNASSYRWLSGFYNSLFGDNEVHCIFYRNGSTGSTTYYRTNYYLYATAGTIISVYCLSTSNPVDVSMIEKIITANGIYTAANDNADGYSMIDVSITPTLQSKTVTSNGAVTPDEGYDGLSEVNVALPTWDESYTVTPTTEAQTLSTAGKVMEQDVTIQAPNTETWTFTLDDDTEVTKVVGVYGD